MKIGTLLPAVIVSLATVAGGLAVYVAVTKHDTMDRISEAQQRLAIVRVVGEIPRYFSPERGATTNFMYQPAIDPKDRSVLAGMRQQTDGAVEKMEQLKKTGIPGLDDGPAIAAAMGDLKTRFDELRRMMDNGLVGPVEARRGAVKPIVAGYGAFSKTASDLIDNQVRLIAQLNGNAYRQANYANMARALREIGGLNSALHKNTVANARVATEAERLELSHIQGMSDQALAPLAELRGNPSTPPNVAAALKAKFAKP